MGSICKLVIKACSDNKFSSSTEEFTALVNPEDIVMTSGVNYAASQGSGRASALRYYQSTPKVLSFKLFFDNTGVIPGSNNKISVTEQLEKLQAITYDIQDKINAPNYIRVIWGKIDFKGRLISLKLNYTMFQTDGTLVRAEADISVIEEKVFTHQGRNVSGEHGLKESDSHQEGGSVRRINRTGDPPVGEDGTIGGPVDSESVRKGNLAKEPSEGDLVVSQGSQSAAVPVVSSQGSQSAAVPVVSSQGSQSAAVPVVSSQGSQSKRTGGLVTSSSNNKIFRSTRSGNQSYKTKGGDTLPKLSKRHLGDRNAFKKYATLNKLHRLRPLPTGTILKTLGGLSAGIAGLTTGILLGSKWSWLQKFIKKAKEKGKILIDKGKTKSQGLSQKGKTKFQNVSQKTKEKIKKVTKK